MNKGLIFFCCACAILLFTIINLSVGPIVTGAVVIGEPKIAKKKRMIMIKIKEQEMQKNMVLNGFIMNAKELKECMIWNIHLLFLIRPLDSFVVY